MSGLGFIAAERPQQCDLCGDVAELRPYGPNGECVCFTCGMQDERAVERRFVKLVLGEDGKELEAQQ